MRIALIAFSLGLPLSAWLATTLSGQAGHHHPVYLMGGFETPATQTTYPRGLYLYDKSGPTPALTTLCRVPYTMSMQHNVRMDYDNRNLIGFTRGINTTLTPWSGCMCRYDAAAKTWTSLVRFPRSGTSYPQAYFFEHGLRPIVDQDGDYVFMHYRLDRITSPSTVQRINFQVMHYDRVTSAVSTLLTSVQLPFRAYTGFSQLGRDIDTGRLMIGGWQATSPRTWRYPVWTLDPESGYGIGSLGTWNDGSTHGWRPAGYTMEQNVRNGYLEGPGDSVRYVNQLRPGTSRMTTLTTVTFPFPQVQHGARFDLQTAARPRFLLGGFHAPFGAWLLEFDVKPWRLTTFDTVLTTPRTRYPYLYWQDFYRGRHIQTVRTARDRWDIRLSCPQYPRKRYVLVASLAGVRPAVSLPDGRRINLLPDELTRLTLFGLVPTIFHPGPGALDANGEAKGVLDVSLLARPPGGWGVPLWIAMAVVDPLAPTAIAYLPDTYVMRL